MTYFEIVPTEEGHTPGPRCPCKPDLKMHCFECDGQDPDCWMCGGELLNLGSMVEGCLIMHNQTTAGQVEFALILVGDDCEIRRN